jgi:hypothetical protein
MNAIIKIIITGVLAVLVLSLLSLISLTFFGAKVVSTSIWLFSALLPFRGILNLPAILYFIVELMAFELAYWSFMLVDKAFEMYTGSSLRTSGRMDSSDQHVYGNKEKYRERDY